MKDPMITVDEAKEHLEALDDEANDEIKAQKAIEALFWKQEADTYLMLTTRIGANGARYSARVKSSARPGWLCSKPRRRRGSWMVGDGQNQMAIQFYGQMMRSDKKGHTKRRVTRKTGRGQ